MNLKSKDYSKVLCWLVPAKSDWKSSWTVRKRQQYDIFPKDLLYVFDKTFY